MKGYTYALFLLMLSIVIASSCNNKGIPSETDMSDTIEHPSIIKEVDDASMYMADTNRVTTDDSLKNAIQK